MLPNNVSVMEFKLCLFKLINGFKKKYTSTKYNNSNLVYMFTRNS